MAKKLDSRSWVPHYFSGWANLELGKYTASRADFQMALRNSEKTPQPAVYDAMALLLAACPLEVVRDGNKAVEYAANACKLTEQKNWMYLDSFGAAAAEVGNYAVAAKWARKAMELAPTESREPIRQRIALYQRSEPYRLQ